LVAHIVSPLAAFLRLMEQRFGGVDYSQGTFAATAPVGHVAGHWLTFAKCSGDVCLIQSHVSNLPMPAPPK
jgi:hypothetical protein